jgi:F0F1-type ATP synthase assembly protein I
VKKNKSVFQALVLVTQFGISMLVPILLCTLLGVYIGKRFSIPIIAVPLFLIGALAGFRNVYRLAKSVYEDKDVGNAKKDQ